MRVRLFGTGLGAFAVIIAAGASAAPPTFRKVILTDKFHAEAAGVGDIDKDGHGDAVYGPYWYAGPEFKERHEIYPAKDFDPNQYSNNFMTGVGDVDGEDTLVRGLYALRLAKTLWNDGAPFSPLPLRWPIDG